MKKLVIATALIAAIASPALAQRQDVPPRAQAGQTYDTGSYRGYPLGEWYRTETQDW